MITVRIPGPPFSQPRPKARAQKTKSGEVFVQIYEPAEAKAWKGAAQVHMLEALRVAGLSAPAYPPDVPLEVFVTAVFACPKSDYRKIPVPRRPYLGLKDWDNIGKAVCDAANGVLYVDDRYITRGTVEAWVGAQEEAPYVEIEVSQFRGPLMITRNASMQSRPVWA